MNSLTVNLHLMLASFYRPAGERRRILIEAGAFSSDRHAVASQIAWHGLDPESTLLELAPRAGEDTVSEAAIEACLAAHGGQIALVLWPGVQFRTGQVFDLARIARAAHAHGCIAGFDLAHSIGNVPLALHAADADFAVWCSYKYLNAGPGAIGGCFVHQRHAEAQPRSGHSGALPGARLAGWWGHDESTRFLMEPQFAAARGAASWAVSNPSVFATAPLIASLRALRGGRPAGAAREIARSHRLSRAAACSRWRRRSRSSRRLRPRSAAASCRCASMASATRGRQVFAALGARDMVVDWRTPDIIRVAPVPLYNGFEDAWHFAQALAAALRTVSERRARPQHRRRRAWSGALLALLLARRGLKVTLHERRPDPRQSRPNAAARSTWRSPRAASRRSRRPASSGEVRPLLIPMRGRRVHEVNGESALLPYGQREHEVIYSVSRADAEPGADRCRRAPRRGAGALQPRVPGRRPHDDDAALARRGERRADARACSRPRSAPTAPAPPCARA